MKKPKKSKCIECNIEVLYYTKIRKYCIQCVKSYQKKYHKNYILSEDSIEKRKKADKIRWINKKNNPIEIKKIYDKQKKRYKRISEKEWIKRKQLTIEKSKKNRYKATKRYFLKHPGAKIAQRFRERIYRLLKGRKISFNMNDLIGCNQIELKIHLEKQFKNGMNWNNHGHLGKVWHVDHIKACSKFDLTNNDELKKCFHYTNLQPLWAVDNMRKRNY